MVLFWSYRTQNNQNQDFTNEDAENPKIESEDKQMKKKTEYEEVERFRWKSGKITNEEATSFI